MVGKVLDIEGLIKADNDAVQIANKYREWQIYRDAKLKEWTELRNYLFATDTRTTSVSKLPWSNSTTTPKLTQIRDNLHANYTDALFGRRNWFKWMPDDKESASYSKAKLATSYVLTRIEQSQMYTTADRLLLDWIDTGNCFAYVDWVTDFNIEGEDKIPSLNYAGPKLIRISPYDIVFNPTVDDFACSPKIIKELVTIGDLKKRIESDAKNEYLEEAFDLQLNVRAAINSQDSEIQKSDGYIADGFGTIQQYYHSGYVELLHFIGDIYNADTGELRLNRSITIADRCRVLRDIPNPSWLGPAKIRHSAWRKRPDNLYGMGPLDNLVGLQYRIDHLENLKADAWDQFGHPITLIKGDVEDFDFAPGSRIYAGEEGTVDILRPDTGALNVDQQIDILMNRMEEMAGAPKMSMGFRTPGEKTKFEVGVLDKGANRTFVHKAQSLERDFFEHILNDFLVVGRENNDIFNPVKIEGEDGVVTFKDLKKEDLMFNGRMRPLGSRHFSESALRTQNLQQLWQMKSQDPTMAAHLSGKKMAKIFAEELNESDLFGENVGIDEELEIRRYAEESDVNEQERQQIAQEEGL